jgi:hypothetical protein
MQIGVEGIENLFMVMVLEKKNFQNTKIQKDKHLSIPLYSGIGFTNSILELSKDNLKFSYLNQFL